MAGVKQQLTENVLMKDFVYMYILGIEVFLYNYILYYMMFLDLLIPIHMHVLLVSNSYIQPQITIMHENNDN